MKNLVLLMLLVCMNIAAQEYESMTLFDMSGVTTDTIRPISIKKSRGEGVVAEIDFTGVNCDVLTLDFGYGLTNSFPMFLDTIPNIQMPIILDKNLYTTTYKGLDNNSISFDIFLYNANYLWTRINYDASCTSGEIKLRYKR